MFRSDSTNGTSLRYNHLLLNALQLSPGGRFKIHSEMVSSTRAHKNGAFRINEIVFDNTLLARVHPDIRRKAMRYKQSPRTRNARAVNRRRLCDYAESCISHLFSFREKTDKSRIG